MADAYDDFDIDIYGDDKPEFVEEPADQPKVEPPKPDTEVHISTQETYDEPETEPVVEPPLGNTANSSAQNGIRENAAQTIDLHRQTEPTAGEIGLAVGGATEYQDQSQADFGPDGEDLREVDPSATRAIKLAEVQWWVTEDDIRGWANAARAEDEINEITFNEHKINGKSKGEVFIDLQSPQAATALKRHMDGLGPQQGKRISTFFAAPDFNPYKNLKDGQVKQNNFKDRGQNHQSGYQNNAGFRGRGGGGGYGRGGFNQNRGGYGNQQAQMGMAGGGGGFGGMNGMGGYGGQQMGFNRGGMMGNRGGFQNSRGGGGASWGGNMMGMMPGMNGMGGMAGMNMMNMFNQMQQQGSFGGVGGGDGMNPHGAKRPRQE